MKNFVKAAKTVATITEGKFYEVVDEVKERSTISGKVIVVKDDRGKFSGIDPVNFE